jgi:predicted RNA-binding Zn ribbon-like protein
MSKQSRKFQVPDELANLYDFANTLDVRHFTHHGVQHQQNDELGSAGQLGAWMTERGLLSDGGAITSAMFATALRLRGSLRDYLQHDPGDRHGKHLARSVNAAASAFPLVAEIGAQGKGVLRAARKDALAGLSSIVAEFHDGSRNGTLDRLKMCAAEECRRVFFDRSKPSTRRWCMSTLCGNRIKTRSYRERRREVS